MEVALSLGDLRARLQDDLDSTERDLAKLGAEVSHQPVALEVFRQPCAKL